MAVRKRMLILANSAKAAERCIAGREVVQGVGNTFQFGPWLRPVSDRGQGELKIQERRYACRTELRVFDFAEVTLIGKIDDPHQTENWRIARHLPWRDVSGEYDRPSLEALREDPPDLWFQASEPRTDRVAHGYLGAHPLGWSLCLLRVEEFRFRLLPQDGILPNRPRCMFRYRNVEYEMGLTDPVFLDRYRAYTPALGAPPVEVTPASGCDPLLCVSLTADFHGYHYKVAATVFERPV